MPPAISIVSHSNFLSMVIAYRVVRSKGGQVTKKRRNKVLVYRSFESGGKEGAGSSRESVVYWSRWSKRKPKREQRPLDSLLRLQISCFKHLFWPTLIVFFCSSFIPSWSSRSNHRTATVDPTYSTYLFIKRTPPSSLFGYTFLPWSLLNLLSCAPTHTVIYRFIGVRIYCEQ